MPYFLLKFLEILKTMSSPIKYSLLSLGIIAYGTLGYSYLEGWSFLDALYMTIITLSTTGYEEVNKLSSTGRWFTMTLIIFGVGMIAYISANFFDNLTDNLQHRGRKKMENKIKKLNHHTIVLGFGRMGKSVCNQLAHAGKNFVVIESNPDLIDELESRKYHWIQGDGADDENLKKAGIFRASHLVSVVDNEADGLFAAIAAKSLNPEIYVIVRADSEQSRRKMEMAGADKVILPYLMSGRKIAHQIIQPNIEDFLELSNIDGEKKTLKLVDILVTEDSPLATKTLKNCGLRRDGLMVVGIKRSDQNFIFAPDADMKFVPGDIIIAIGSPQSME